MAKSGGMPWWGILLIVLGVLALPGIIIAILVTIGVSNVAAAASKLAGKKSGGGSSGGAASPINNTPGCCKLSCGFGGVQPGIPMTAAQQSTMCVPGVTQGCPILYPGGGEAPVQTVADRASQWTNTSC